MDYKTFIIDKIINEELINLQNKTLVVEPCHGDVLIELIENYSSYFE